MSRSRLDLGSADRFRAWLVTGPPGRFAALAIEFVAAWGRVLRRRSRD